MGATRFKLHLSDQHRILKRMLKEGHATVALLYQNGVVINVFMTPQRAVKWMEDNPGDNYEVKQMKVII